MTTEQRKALGDCQFLMERRGFPRHAAAIRAALAELPELAAEVEFPRQIAAMMTTEQREALRELLACMERIHGAGDYADNPAWRNAIRAALEQAEELELLRRAAVSRNYADWRNAQDEWRRRFGGGQ